MEQFIQWIKSDIGVTIAWIVGVVFPVIGLIATLFKFKKSKHDKKNNIINQSIQGDNNQQAGKNIIKRRVNHDWRKTSARYKRK